MLLPKSRLSLPRGLPTRKLLFYAALFTLTLMLSNLGVAAGSKVAEAALQTPAPTAGDAVSQPLSQPAQPAQSAQPVSKPVSQSFPSTISQRQTFTPILPAPISSLDNEVLAAKAAFDRRDLKALDTARQQFFRTPRQIKPKSEHPLASYIFYWWASANLAAANTFAVTGASAIQAFLANNSDTSLADSLRRDWLRALGVADRWDLFNPAFAQLITDDAEVTCHSWRYRLSQNDREAVSEAKAFWNTGKAAPDACYTVFQAINDTNTLSADDVWLRVRLLLENKLVNDARRSAAYAKNLPANFERATASINLDPRSYLSREKPDAKSRPSVELYLFAVTRLARDDPSGAAALLERNANYLSTADRSYAWAQVGQYGGMQHEPDTLDWFLRAQDTPLNDTQAVWKARAALRLGKWPQVRSAILAMSASERREPSWRYWLARSLENSLGKSQPADANNAAYPTANETITEQIKKLKEPLARENNFYALLAAEELGITAHPNWQGYKPAPAEVDAMAARAGMKRILALYRLELKPEGLREWQFTTRLFNDQELLAAAEVARRSNIPDRAISAADRTVVLHDFSQRYPIPYRDALKPSAENQQLDEAWVYGLIRQESRFMADVKSRVGAMGLMQLMPATAAWVAKQAGMKKFSVGQALDVPINLTLGTFYLRHVLDDLGHPVLATAAYNAGPGRARRWRAETPLEGAIYAETIPFAETRDYVKKVMANKWYYRNRFGGTPIKLAEIMGTVPGRTSGRNAAAARSRESDPPAMTAISAPATDVSALAPVVRISGQALAQSLSPSPSQPQSQLPLHLPLHLPSQLPSPLPSGSLPSPLVQHLTTPDTAK